MNLFLPELTALLILFTANGAFAFTEMALVSARKSKLRQWSNEGKKRASQALALARQPSEFLSTIQIFITAIGILAGAIGGLRFVGYLSVLLERVPLLAPYSEPISTVVVVTMLTYIFLVFAELVPKRMALSSPETIACRVSAPMAFLTKLAYPLVKVLSLSTETVVRVFGLPSVTEPAITDKEIEVIVEEGTKRGVFYDAEREMVMSAFKLDEKLVCYEQNNSARSKQDISARKRALKICIRSSKSF